MKPAAAAALVAGLLSAAACAPVIEGGPPLGLPPGLMETARVDVVILSTDWLEAESDFSDTFAEEVREELAMCAYGTYPLHLRVHVDRLERDSRLGVLLRGHGEHGLSAVAELVDPARGDEVVGRYPITVVTQAGGRLAGLLGDRQMMVAEEYGRALCAEAFGRNPRRDGPMNATRG